MNTSARHAAFDSNAGSPSRISQSPNVRNAEGELLNKSAADPVSLSRGITGNRWEGRPAAAHWKRRAGLAAGVTSVAANRHAKEIDERGGSYFSDAKGDDIPFLPGRRN
jgi:hypothetical protein